MVNKYLLLFIALCSLHTYAQDSRFRINGTVDTKYDNALVTLFTFTGNVIRSVDSCYVKDGHFGFQGTEYLYEKSIISLGNYPDTVLYAELMLGRGDIFVKLAPKSVVESPLVDEYKAWKDSCSVYWRRFFKAEKEKKDEMYNQYWACRYAFEKKHIHNALGRNLFLDELNNTIPDCPYFIQMCDSLYEMLSERDKSRGDVKEQYKRWGKKKRQLQMIGKRFVDFAFVDTLGNERKLSEYVGTHDLLFLDFWASWCGPCRAQEPHLVRLYREYKDKGFEILGISLDVDRVSWLSVLRKKENHWTDLCIANKEDDKRLRELYAISGIPYGLLIDKSGKITAVVTAGWRHLEMLLKTYYKDVNGLNDRHNE